MVTKLRYANTNIYLLRGDKGNVLVDTEIADYDLNAPFV